MQSSFPNQTDWFSELPKDYFPPVMSSNSSLDSGGITTLGGQKYNLLENLQGFPQVAGSFTLGSDIDNVQSLVSSPQVPSGSTSVVTSSHNFVDSVPSSPSSLHCLTNQCKASVGESLAALHDLPVELAAPFLHSCVVSASDSLDSFPRLHSSVSSFSSLEVLEHSLLTELGIQGGQNLLSSASCLVHSLCSPSKSIGNFASPHIKNFLEYSVEKSTRTKTAREAYSVSLVGTALLPCNTFPKRESMHDLGAWSTFSVEQVCSNAGETLNNKVPQPRGVSFQSIETLPHNLSGGMPMKNKDASSQVSNSTLLRENSSPAHIFSYERIREDLWDSMGLNFKLGNGLPLPLCDDSLFTVGDKNLPDFTISPPACISELDMNSLLYLDKIGAETSSDNLLEAVVAKILFAKTDEDSDDLSSKSTLTKANNTSMYKAQSQSSTCSAVKDNTGSPQLPPDVNAQKALHNLQNGLPPGPQVSSWGEGSHSVSAEISVTEQKANEPLKINRKRARPGESTRPRPKDRQLIQDRVKELREIVPNGGKCSIDSLLDRTIKHMVFLQNVAKHANKLKQAGETRKVGIDLPARDNMQNGAGATWAFELGYPIIAVPIIVGDLNQAGQMLIEMLCEERGFFLEIADLIRSFGLTILKGVMEARNGKIRAHFVVEANQVVTWMDVFVTLVRLFDQAPKSFASPCNLPSVLNDKVVFPTFDEAMVLRTIRVAEMFQ